MAVTSLILVPFLVVRMPAAYFVAKRRQRKWTLSRRVLYLFRNVFALILFVAGLAMLFLPGQGLLTLLIALLVSDLPGKYRIERWFVKKPGVLKSLNWIRRRYDRVPLKRPE